MSIPFIARLAFAATLCSLAAWPALARQNPTPVPSGITIHLFGPNAFTANVLPAAAGSTTAPANMQGGPAAATAGPDLSALARQMFVTGDPAEQGRAAFAKGRNGAH